MNQWPFVSGWFTPTFSTLPPQVVGIPLATLLLVAGAGAVVVGLAWRRVTPPVPLVAVVLVFALRCRCWASPGSPSPTATATPPPPTPSPPSAATPAACSARSPSRPTPRPGCSAPAACPSTSAAPRCPASSSTSRSPRTVVTRCAATWVVVTTVGTLRPGDDVRLDFGTETRADHRGRGDTRVIAPAGATRVRLTVDAGAGGHRPGSRSPAPPGSPPWSRWCRPARGRSSTGRSRSCSPASHPSRCRPGRADVAGGAARVRPGGGHHLRAGVRRPVRGAAAAGHAATPADLPRGRSRPRRRPALPLGADHAAEPRRSRSSRNAR